MAVEFRPARQGHDHVYLALGMAMVRTLDILHLDHIHGKTMGRRRRLDDAAEPDAAGLSRAHPAGGDRFLAELEDVAEYLAGSGKLGLEEVGQSGIDRPAGDLPGDLRDPLGEGFGRRLGHHRFLLERPRRPVIPERA